MFWILTVNILSMNVNDISKKVPPNLLQIINLRALVLHKVHRLILPHDSSCPGLPVDYKK